MNGIYWSPSGNRCSSRWVGHDVPNRAEKHCDFVLLMGWSRFNIHMIHHMILQQSPWNDLRQKLSFIRYKLVLLLHISLFCFIYYFFYCKAICWNLLSIQSLDVISVDIDKLLEWHSILPFGRKCRLFNGSFSTDYAAYCYYNSYQRTLEM